MNNDKSDLPKDVENNIRFLQSKKIWHILSENPVVKSCNDAAANRNRLGNKGIPIFDELKSELGFFINNENKKQKVLVHCRGNQKLDRLKISGVLNSEYQRITNSKGIKGLINPFGKQFRNLLQIFDISTTKIFHPPYTMMTNAGDFKYALEFEVNSLVDSLKNIKVEDIIRVDNYTNYVRHKIGILTGNGPDSGILLWEKINESIKKELLSRLEHSFRGDLSYPEIVVSSVPDMGISMELDKRAQNTENTVVKSVINLCQNGITIMCIACNTTQYYKNKIEGICNLYNIKFVSIPEVINDYLRENQIREFDFLGISHVVDFEKLSAFKELDSKYTISKPNANAIKKIEKIAYTAKNDIDKARNYLIDLIKNYTRYNIIIVALTEISTILSKSKNLVNNKTIIDSLQLLAEHISLMYINGIFETLYVDKYKDFLYFELLKNDAAKKDAEQELRNILYEIDYEFIPPLSYRPSTTFLFKAKTKNYNKPESYLQNLLNQEIIVSRKKSNNQIIGFMSYIPNHSIKIRNKQDMACHYISTIGITKGERGHGITNQFYKMIEEIVNRQKTNNFIATRTWSTNKTHIKILTDLGYKKVLTQKNDRGNGIHTVYFAKEIRNKKAEDIFTSENENI
jgi:aspartate/glutamate racemase